MLELGGEDAELGFPDEDSGTGLDACVPLGAEELLALPVNDLLLGGLDAVVEDIEGLGDFGGLHLSC